MQRKGDHVMKMGNMLVKWWKWDQDDLSEKWGWEEGWKEIDNQGKGDMSSLGSDVNVWSQW